MKITKETTGFLPVLLLLLTFIRETDQVTDRGETTERKVCTGETVTLPCHSSLRLGVDWWHTPASNITTYVVASGFVQAEFKERFRLNRTTRGQQNLVIRDVRIEDEAVYTCVEDAGIGPKHHRPLTVYGRCNGQLSAGSSQPLPDDQLAPGATDFKSVYIIVPVLVVLMSLLVIAFAFLMRQHRKRRRRENDVEGRNQQHTNRQNEMYQLQRQVSQNRRENEHLESELKQLKCENQRDEKTAELEEKIKQLTGSFNALRRQQTTKLHEERVTLELENKIKELTGQLEKLQVQLCEERKASSAENDKDDARRSLQTHRGSSNEHTDEKKVTKSSGPVAQTSTPVQRESQAMDGGHQSASVSERVSLYEKFQKGGVETPTDTAKLRQQRRCTTRRKLSFLSKPKPRMSTPDVT